MYIGEVWISLILLLVVPICFIISIRSFLNRGHNFFINQYFRSTGVKPSSFADTDIMDIRNGCYKQAGVVFLLIGIISLIIFITPVKFRTIGIIAALFILIALVFYVIISSVSISKEVNRLAKDFNENSPMHEIIKIKIDPGCVKFYIKPSLRPVYVIMADGEQLPQGRFLVYTTTMRKQDPGCNELGCTVPLNEKERMELENEVIKMTSEEADKLVFEEDDENSPLHEVIKIKIGPGYVKFYIMPSLGPVYVIMADGEQLPQGRFLVYTTTMRKQDPGCNELGCTVPLNEKERMELENEVIKMTSEEADKLVFEEDDYEFRCPHFYCIEYIENNHHLIIDIDLRDPVLYISKSLITHWEPPYDNEPIDEITRDIIYERLKRKLEPLPRKYCEYYYSKYGVCIIKVENQLYLQYGSGERIEISNEQSKIIQAQPSEEALYQYMQNNILNPPPVVNKEQAGLPSLSLDTEMIECLSCGKNNAFLTLDYPVHGVWIARNKTGDRFAEVVVATNKTFDDFEKIVKSLCEELNVPYYEEHLRHGLLQDLFPFACDPVDGDLISFHAAPKICRYCGSSSFRKGLVVPLYSTRVNTFSVTYNNWNNKTENEKRMIITNELLQL